MLTEITHLRQTNRSLIKRWFNSRDMDLFIWEKQSNERYNMPVQFQLSFNKQSDEKIICWSINGGFHLYRVDSGEHYPDRYKKTPILICSFDKQDITDIARDFLAASENIDIGIADFIYARLLEYPGMASLLHAMHVGQTAHNALFVPDKDR